MTMLRDFAHYYRSMLTAGGLGLISAGALALGIPSVVEVAQGGRQEFLPWLTTVLALLVTAQVLFGSMTLMAGIRRTKNIGWAWGLAGSLAASSVLIAVYAGVGGLALVVSAILACLFVLWGTLAWRHWDEFPSTDAEPAGRGAIAVAAFVAVSLGVLSATVGPWLAYRDAPMPAHMAEDGRYAMGESKDRKVAVMFGVGQKESGPMLQQLEALKGMISDKQLEAAFLPVFPPVDGLAGNAEAVQAATGLICAGSDPETGNADYLSYLIAMGADMSAGPTEIAKKAGLGEAFTNCFYSGVYQYRAQDMVATAGTLGKSGVLTPPRLAILGDDTAYKDVSSIIAEFNRKAGR